MPSKKPFIIRVFSLLWKTINGFRKLVLNLIFFGILAAIVVAMNQESAPQVPQDAALVLNLTGTLVEQEQELDPFTLLASGGEEQEQEIELQALIEMIEHAAGDERISGIVLRPAGLRAGTAKLQQLGDALQTFKASGKPVIAQGGWFGQNPYLLASYADEVQLDTSGMVSIDGMGMYRLFYKEVLDKIGVKTHLFRVGKYKSFAEGYTRTDMSAEAKEANMALLGDIWGHYKTLVSANRDIDPALLDASLEEVEAGLRAADGDFAQFALQLGLVDKVMTSVAMRDDLIERFGTLADDDSKFNGIGWRAYQAQIQMPFDLPSANPKVAVIVAQGAIVPGDQPNNLVGGRSMSKLLREAREDDDVKAVVIRVDSPGGSVSASEQIRQEVLALKAAGKTVVSSMSSVAASGGYWISANADRIYAMPSTITGSIGIIGMIQTFEDTAKTIGVNFDGVGTTELAGINALSPLPDRFKAIMQLSLDKGYKNFITLVSTSRGLELDKVEELAQGRVWSGIQAKELGLVDELGGLEDAIKGAAELAGLEQYDVKNIKRPLSPEQELLREFMKEANIELPQASTSPLMQMVKRELLAPIEQQLILNDPKNAFLLCLECSEL